MSKMFALLTCCALPCAGIATPAFAGPNVFWTFGLDQHYLHGAGGRAELPRKEFFAYAGAVGSIAASDGDKPAPAVALSSAPVSVAVSSEPAEILIAAN